MDMKKILLSMILLALCLIQASADNYYYKIKLYNDNGQPGGWSKYIEVSYDDQKKVYHNGLRDLINGKTVTDEGDGHGNNIKEYKLPKTADNKVDTVRIWGIVFANGKGRGKSEQLNIMEGDEYKAWMEIRKHIKYLELREYEHATHTNKGYFMDMFNLEELELPKDGMTVGNGEDDCNYYFANALKLKKIIIWSDERNDHVDITDNAVKDVTDKKLLNIVGKFMFSNCYSLSTKYINRLIKDVTRIKSNAFCVDDDNRDTFSDDADNKMAIEIPSSVTKIGHQAFRNRVKVTGLNIHGNGGCLEIGSEAFGACDELAKIKLQDNKELKIYKNAFRGCKQLNAFENMNNAKITYLGTGVFGDCRSMTNDFVNGVLQNYADNGGTKIPAYLFWGCNGQDGHDGTVKNKNVCSFTDLIIPAQFTEIGDGAFAYNGTDENVIKLKTITVNSEKAPTCLQGETDEYVKITNKSVFNGLDPNLTTVTFDNGAKGWNENKETHETTGFLTYMNDGSEFQRLLTKDLYSNHTEYINVPQQHAIVRLHRTLKEGWNTICLPFGVNNRYGSMWEGYSAKQFCNARIIVNGLTHNDSKADGNNFTMGVYRGYWPEGKTFMFLHYTDFDAYPLDLGETFLVKMRSDDIKNAEKDDKGVAIYTFRNVDLNYRWSATGGNDGKWTLEKISAGDMSAKDFNGEVNTDAIPFKGKASYVDYVLRGSLVQRTGTVGDSKVGITTDDYFFQQSKNGTMKLYRYTAGKTYGIRGFSGWFHRNNSNSNAHELSLSLFDDSSTTPIETVKVDDLNRDTSGKVYSISGVLVKNNAADLNNLSKGIYIVNGKKYVVK